jgi:hypothetical protein
MYLIFAILMLRNKFLRYTGNTLWNSDYLAPSNGWVSLVNQTWK